MRRKPAKILMLVLALSLLLVGCGTTKNLTGTMTEQACELQAGSLNLYLGEKLQGNFAFAQTEGGWTIQKADGQYVAYDAESSAVTAAAEPYAWAYENGSFSTSEGSVYLGDGLTASAEAVAASFTTTADVPENDTSDAPQDTALAPQDTAPAPQDAEAAPTTDSAQRITASVEMNGTTTYYPSFRSLWFMVDENPDVAMTITLLADYSVSTAILPGTRTAPVTVDLNGHTLSTQCTHATSSGSIFHFLFPGTYVIKNGTLTGGNNYGYGGCIDVKHEGVDLTLQNLTITGNHTDFDGSALYLAPVKSTVTLDNVTVTDNTADGSGAIFWAIDGTSRSTLVFKNKVEIINNRGSGGLNNLVYDGKGWCGWLNTDTMATGSKIGVSYSDGYAGPLADSFGTRVNELESCFVADQDDHDIGIFGDRLVVKFKQDKVAYIDNGEWELYSTFKQAWEAATWYADRNITLGLLMDIGPEELNEMGELTIPERTGTLTLDLNNHTINRGLTTATDSGAVFKLQNKGTLTIKNGTISGGNCIGDGGCFYIDKEGLDLTLENLTISGNHSTKNGSALYLTPAKSAVTLDNVTITDNDADGSGAVFWAIDGTSRAKLVLKNKIEVVSNSGSGGLCNLVYDGHGWCGWMNTDELATSSNIGVSYADGYGGPLADSFGSRLEELRGCFFADQSNHDITSGDGTLVVKFKQDKAAVIHKGNWDLYSSFAQAWAAADGSEQSSDTTMILFGDWVATKNSGFDDDGGYGKDCHFFKAGALCPKERDNNSWLILDLNGYTMDAKKANRIVTMIEKIRMKIKNGTLTGGYHATEGGAIWVSEDDIQLDLSNLVITGNTSKLDGSAISVFEAESINFDTVSVENNYVESTTDSACAVILKSCDIRMQGKMLIRNNSNKKNPGKGLNNLLLGDYIDDLGDINSDMAGSEIHLTNIYTKYNPKSELQYLDIIGLALGKDTKGCRYLTEDSVSVKENAALFIIDQNLRDRGYEWIKWVYIDSNSKGKLAIFDWDRGY